MLVKQIKNQYGRPIKRWSNTLMTWEKRNIYFSTYGCIFFERRIQDLIDYELYLPRWFDLNPKRSMLVPSERQFKFYNLV
jgi:hypothetical protein